MTAHCLADRAALATRRHPLVNPVVIALALFAAVLLVTSPPSRPISPVPNSFAGAQFVHFCWGRLTPPLPCRCGACGGSGSPCPRYGAGLQGRSDDGHLSRHRPRAQRPDDAGSVAPGLGLARRLNRLSRARPSAAARSAAWRAPWPGQAGNRMTPAAAGQRHSPAPSARRAGAAPRPVRRFRRPRRSPPC